MKFSSRGADGCAREATETEKEAFLRANAGLNHAFWRAVKVDSRWVDEDTWPGGSHTPGRFLP